MKKKYSSPVIIAVCVIIVVGFFLRAESMMRTHVIQPLSHDAGQYYQYAYNLRHHHIYSSVKAYSDERHATISPDAIRSPGYPLFLALFAYDLPGEKIYNHILWSQVVLSTLTILFSFLLFRNFLSDVWALAATAFIVICPHLIVANSYILTETLFCFLIVVLSWVSSLFLKKPTIRVSIIMGALIGSAALVKPALNFFPIVMLILMVVWYGRKKGIKWFVGIFIGFVLLFSPWVVRNMITLNKVSDRTLMVNFLHHGMYPDFIYNDVPESYGFPYRYDQRSDEISEDTASVLKEISRRFFQEPLRHLKWFMVKKPFAFSSWNLVQGNDIFVYRVANSPYFSDKVFEWTYRLMRSIHNIILLLCAFGCFAVWLPVSRFSLPKQAIFTARFISVLLIYFTLIHMIGAPFPRYSVPLRPLLYAMALFTLTLHKKYGKTLQMVVKEESTHY